MKKVLSASLAICLAFGLAGCGQKTPSSYPVEVVGPERTSAPAPTQAPDASPTPQPGWVVAPRTDIEITASLADQGTVQYLTTQERQQLSLFTQNGQTGVIDLAGKIVVPAEKDVHWCPVCGITNNGESEIYNARGEVVGVGGHGIGGGSIFYDTATGKVYMDDGMGYLVPWSQDMVYSPEAFIARVVTITPDESANEYYIEGETTPVRLGEVTGYMLFTPEGKPLDNLEYEDLAAQSEGAFAAKMKGSWGFVSAATGEQLVPFVYQQVRPFRNGLAAVKTDTGWGYVSLAGVEKTSMTFVDAQTAVDGKAWVKTAEGWGVAELAAWLPQ